MDELKPCPFCGSKAGLVTGPVKDRFGTMCNGCGAWHDTRAKTKEAAIAAWNARAPSVPEGYTLVPVVPTPEMWEAFKEQVNGQTAWDVWSFKFGKAIAAAPKVPA